MKTMFEEYGGFIVTALSAFTVVGLLFMILTPGNPLHDSVVSLIMSVMP